jgi:hypothetical protein
LKDEKVSLLQKHFYHLRVSQNWDLGLVSQGQGKVLSYGDVLRVRVLEDGDKEESSLLLLC